MLEATVYKMSGEGGNRDWSSHLEDDHCLCGGFVFPLLLQAMGTRET